MSVSSKHPNILFINSDQHRYDCVGVNGNTLIKTPHLDRLAAQGINFNNAFTPIPLCCPARQTLLCGVRPEVHGCLWNYRGGHKIGGLEPDSNQWPSILKKHGYQTAYLGKWHVNPDIDPTAFGYDHYLPYCLSRRPDDWDWTQLKNIIGLDMIDEGDLKTAGTHRLAQACIEQIKKFEQQDTPWHIRLDHDEPHLPNFPVKKFHDMYPPETIPKWSAFDDDFTNKPYIQRQHAHNWDIQDWTWDAEFSRFSADYYAIISQLDDALGKVIDYLEESGAIENTIIIYTTDHGDMTGNHHMIDKHYNMYDDIIHVPMIMRWDGVITPGTSCEEFICHYLDLAPTILDIINADIPDSYQGESLLDILRGEQARQSRDYVLSSYNGHLFGLYTQRMIRTHDLKLVWNLSDIDELYDLKNDPAELINQVGNPEYQDQLRALRLKLYDALKEACDPLVDTVWMREQLLYNRKID
jgi:arylsulfatase A-like enzyme